MNRVGCIFIAFGLAAAGSTALAAEPAKPPRVLMTDAQMDNVTAGALDGLVTVVVQESLSWNLDALRSPLLPSIPRLIS
jgi:hypothetical protein